MECTVLVCFAVKSIIPWQLAAVFMIKELFMVCGAVIVLKKIKVTVKSKWYGKVTTSVFYAIAFAVFAVYVFNINVNAAAAGILFAAALLLTLASMVLYIIDTLKINAELKNKENIM
jgi:cardiolipin synthase